VGLAIRTFQAAAREKDLELREAIDDQVPDYVIGDATRVRQVLFNLLSNAIKFTQRGHVAVEVRLVELGSRTARTLFSVSDTGPGIPEDKRQLIFEPFRQSDILHSKTGAGLGLAISKKLANLMGGAIVVNSRLGIGSTFFFTAQFGIDEDSPASDSVLASVEREAF
jgi:signal transduction histidine kinase